MAGMRFCYSRQGSSHSKLAPFFGDDRNRELKSCRIWDMCPTPKLSKIMDIRLMEEILHQLIGSLSHYLQGLVYLRWCRMSSNNSIMVTSLASVWNQSPWEKLCGLASDFFLNGHALVRSATNGRKSVLVCALHLATSTGHCSCDAGCWPNKFRNKYALLNLDFTKDRWIESFQGYTKNHKDTIVPSITVITV